MSSAKPIVFIIAFILALYFLLLLTCANFITGTTEELGSFSIGNYNFIASSDCDAFAGGCSLWIEKTRKKHLWFNSTDILLGPDRDYYDAKFEELSDSLVIIGLKKVANLDIIDPYIILPITRTNSLPALKELISRKNWNLVNRLEQDQFSASLYQSTSDESDYWLEIWKTDSVWSRRNVLFVECQDMEFRSLYEDRIEVTLKHEGFESQTDILISLWQGKLDKISISITPTNIDFQ